MLSFALRLTLLLGLQEKLEHSKDPLEDVKARVEKKEAVLLDVREQKEWDEGHLQAATLLALSVVRDRASKDGFADWLAERVPKKAVVYVHCRSGARSLTAAGILKKQGYDVRPLKQGFEELKRAGFKAD